MRIIGMMARSWKIRIPRSVLPETVSTSPRSCRTFMTIAVLESETKNPKKIASVNWMPPGKVHQSGCSDNGCYNLQDSPDNDHPPGPKQFLERELKADGKEQQDDADLANRLDGGLVRHDRQGVRAGKDADDQETDDAGNSEMDAGNEKGYGQQPQTYNREYHIHGFHNPDDFRVFVLLPGSWGQGDRFTIRIDCEDIITDAWHG